MMNTNSTYLLEKCANCGLPFGSHHGGTSPWPYNYCLGNEGQMDWDEGPRTVFKSIQEDKKEDS